MSYTWVIVADSARARIFDFDQKQRSLGELEDLVHPESRLKQREISADRPGSTYNRTGPGRHGVDSRSNVAAVERHEFAREVARYLESAVNSNRVEKLVLIAGPGFLGDLRAALNSTIRKHVVLELNKDLSMQSPEAVLEHLPKKV